ncbi:hypothetical protein IRJ41_011331 [Triplophysa rosa]|uniref:Uncharacterized protein n=1 Tax=Triplophysa rosa TaxID=992332 RepID=A0A9W7WIK5_TRIRA|nr:hypothetical protein IRJ41_011331 [Triplophysa rosa]
MRRIEALRGKRAKEGCMPEKETASHPPTQVISETILSRMLGLFLAPSDPPVTPLVCVSACESVRGLGTWSEPRVRVRVSGRVLEHLRKRRRRASAAQRWTCTSALLLGVSD